MSVLIIAAHPDDEVLGCGGVIARHVAQGETVHVLVATKGIPEIFSAEQTRQTRMELDAARRVLGYSEVHYLDFPAPKLDSVPGHELADGIKHVISRVQAETVYLPHGGDIHGDHRAVYTASLVAARPIGDCPVKRLLCYETLSETEWSPPTGNDAFIPTVFIDIADYLDKKLEAIACYRSQVKEPPHPRSPQIIKALAQFRGSTVNLFAAEAFSLVRETIK
jgi:LmbE family N-acetylglucosaminyl deacetylase